MQVLAADKGVVGNNVKVLVKLDNACLAFTANPLVAEPELVESV